MELLGHRGDRTGRQAPANQVRQVRVLDRFTEHFPPTDIMNSGSSCILTINGGSSSIRFALYEAGEPLKRTLSGTLDRIGLSGTNLTFNGDTPALAVPDHKSAAGFLIDWIENQSTFASIRAVGHRVVHGMKHSEPEMVTR